MRLTVVILRIIFIEDLLIELSDYDLCSAIVLVVMSDMNVLNLYILEVYDLAKLLLCHKISDTFQDEIDNLDVHG